MSEIDEIKASIKGKVGLELFRELLRLLPSLLLEDYYKNGNWQNDNMRLDIEILASHRIEAEGSLRHLPPLSEVKTPDLPPLLKLSVMSKAAQPVLPAAAATANPQVAVPGPVGPGSPRAAPSVTSAPQTKTPEMDGARVDSSTLAAMAKTTQPGAVPADLRHIALFLSRWKLQPAKTRALLANLSPSRRRFVVQGFHCETVNGLSPVDKLGEYIQRCEKEKLWPADVEAAAAEVSGASTAGSNAGVKRPAEAPAGACSAKLRTS